MLFKPIIPFVEYMVFYDYIKNELCVNKEKVEMNCNGKCYLTKELAKTSDTQDNEKKRITIENNIVYYEETESDIDLPINFYIHKLKIPSNYSLNYSFLKIDYVFRPPTV